MSYEGTPVSQFAITVEQVKDFEFRVRFDNEAFAPLTLDEPPPLGHDAAPNAARVLAAAIGNCLAASLVFCLKKAKVTASDVKASVAVEIVRTPERRLRIGKVDVTLHTSIPEADPALQGCLGMFEDFCVVTQSVRRGIDVAVRVEGAA
jgi:organic hydroperoxide reductase OsmC/OhrA